MNLLIVILGRGGATRLRLTTTPFQVMIKTLNLMTLISSQTM